MTFNGVLFGRRLKAARALAGLNLRQVAQASGLSYEVVRKMDAGERKTKPSWPELDAVARAVNQHADWLLRLDFSLEDIPPRATEADEVEGVAGPSGAEEQAAAEEAAWLRVELRLRRIEEALEKLQSDQADPPPEQAANGT